MQVFRLSLWAGALALAGSLFLAPAMAQDEKPDATIEIDQAQFALLASVSAGGGKLMYQGQTYEFQIGGLGVGGVGVADIKAHGNVFNLKNVEDFYGIYGQGRINAAVADKGAGELWLKNTDGVELQIKVDSDGLILDLGADGVLIEKR